MYAPEVVCFCDIPIEDLAIHMEKFSRFGLSFLKSFLVSRGASPVFYVARESEVTFVDSDAIQEKLGAAISGGSRTHLNEKIRELAFSRRSRGEHFDSFVQKYHCLWEVSRQVIARYASSPGVPPEERLLQEVGMFLDFHVFSFVKFFDHAEPEDAPGNFYMEREWRVVGNVNFALGDVNRVVIPRVYGRRFRDDMAQYAGQVTFVD